jgi:cell wall-associated NlpC family hydrolase
LSDRVSSRHRAPQPAITAWSDLSTTVTGQLAVIGRSGAIVALSSGLLAAMTVPADALASRPGLSTGTSHSTGTSARLSGLYEGFPTVPALRGGLRHSAARTSPRHGSHAAPAGSTVLAVAARYVGIPYRYGGTTPRGFDCSGFTGYVYRQFGISLPRTANEQMLATRRISRSQARRGDLVFFVSGGRAYHAGIYAGRNLMYDSPRSGKTLQRREIWSSDVIFTRVGR